MEEDGFVWRRSQAQKAFEWVILLDGMPIEDVLVADTRYGCVYIEAPRDECNAIIKYAGHVINARRKEGVVECVDPYGKVYR